MFALATEAPAFAHQPGDIYSDIYPSPKRKKNKTHKLKAGERADVVCGQNNQSALRGLETRSREVKKAQRNQEEVDEQSNKMNGFDFVTTLI